MIYPNDDFADATVLVGTAGSITPFHYDGVGDSASSEPEETTIGAGETLWWKWTAPFSGTAFFTTRYSPSDDDGYGLDTKIQVFSDFGTPLDSNDDDPAPDGPPSGSFGLNSYLEIDVTTGDTLYIQVDQYDTGQAGTLHLAWGQVVTPTGPVPGPWITDSATTLDQEVRDNFYGGGEYHYPSASYPYAGGSWADAAEGASGVGSSFLHSPPKRSSYALFGLVGDLPGDPPEDYVPVDGYAVELNPFNLDLYGRITSIQMPAPDLPAGALGWEYEGYPRDTYGLAYRPYLSTDRVTSAQIRALLEVNRVPVPSSDPAQTADAGWTWITAPVAGLAGPQHVVFRYDGPDFDMTTSAAHLDFSWDGYAGESTSIQATSGVSGSYAVFDLTIELGPQEFLSEINAGYIADDTHVHWSVPYVGGIFDYLQADLPAAGDMPLFLPQPLTVQLRMTPIDGGSKWRSGATLAGYPLLYEHTTAGTLNESVDTGWVDLDPTTTANGLYVHYAEQVSHAPPEPSSLPARLPRHYHLSSSYGYQPGQTQVFGSTVAFERPDEGGTYERLLLRLVYQTPRHRFLFPATPTALPPPLRQVGRADRSRQYPRAHVDGSRQTGRIP